jgi:predicted dehydrogenase
MLFMASPHPDIRTAVLGYGLAGRVFHCPFVAAVPGLQLAAIAVRSPESAQRTASLTAAAYPGVPVLSSMQAALDDPAIDLIVVATPNDTHVELAEAALRAGKHVVVDKPLAPTSHEANHLIDLAARHGRVLAPFHNRRFDGDFLTLRKLAEDNTLGRITEIQSHYDRYRPLQRPNTWKEASGPASGVLFDLGPHLIDQALALFGSPTHITASVRSDRDQTDIVDAFDITLDYSVPANSPSARPLRYLCSATMLAAEPSPRFLVHGTHGSYTKFGLDPQEATLIAGGRPPRLGSSILPGKEWLPEPQSAWGILTSALQREEPVKLERSDYPTVTGDYRLFYANVRDAIRGDAALAIPAAAGFRTIRLIELAIQSSQEKRTLPVNFTA